jgi:hypothetical protein
MQHIMKKTASTNSFPHKFYVPVTVHRDVHVTVHRDVHVTVHRDESL